ncbi:MAG: VWA domain-containing protein [Chloroflexota bacterium]
MSLLWPGFLFLLVLVPLIIGIYIWAQRRKRVALRYSSLSLVRAAIPQYSFIRRHLPFALFLLGLASLIVALGRPVQIVSVPTGQATIILTIDVSQSMRQSDITPSRIAAAKSAALSFIESQKSSTQIGIVAFAGYAELIQPPTTDRDTLETAIRSLTTARGTAIGSGIIEAIGAIADIDPSVAPPVTDESPQSLATPVPKGAFVPHIIVVLTDGVTTTGPPPLDAAQQAVDRGIKIYTIGFGTANGSPGFGGGDPFGGGGDPFGGRGDPFGGGQQFGGGGQGQFGGGGFRRGIDEETLQKIADMTEGKYYAASSANELTKVFQDLPTYLITKHEVMELSVLFAALSTVVVAIAMVLSLRWHLLP